MKHKIIYEEVFNLEDLVFLLTACVIFIPHSA